MKREAKKAVVFVIAMSLASVWNSKVTVLTLVLVLVSDRQQMQLLFPAILIFSEFWFVAGCVHAMLLSRFLIVQICSLVSFLPVRATLQCLRLPFFAGNPHSCAKEGVSPQRN